MPLIRAASGLIALSSASGPSSMPPLIWPRSAILHKAAASSVLGHLRVHGLDRRQDRHARLAQAQAEMQVDRVLDDVDLGLEVGDDVDRGVGDEQRRRVGRHVHDEDVADPARGAQAGLLGHDRAHQLVGVQAALHQQLGLAGADQLDGLGRGGVAVRHVDELELPDVEPELLRHAADLVGRPDQDRDHQPGSGRLDGAAQRALVAGVRHRARDRRDAVGTVQQPADSCRAAGRWPWPG